MTGPAFPSQFPPPPLAQKPPSYAAGLTLNIFLPGSGFTYLGRWGWHLGWMLGLGVFTTGTYLLFSILISGRQQSASGAIWLLLFPMVAYLGMLAHYHVVYGQERARFNPTTPPAPSDTTRLLLIIGHFILNFVGFALVGILASVSIPNLLGTRQRAYDTGAQSCAKSIQTALAIAQIDNQTYPTTIDKTISGAGAACAPTQVTVSGFGSKDDYNFTVRDSRGAKTYSVTPASLTAQP